MKTFELQTDNVSVCGNTCMGCERHGKDVMIAFSENYTEGNRPEAETTNTRIIQDVFLTTDQTILLIASLQDTLKRNAEAPESE